MTCQQPVLSPSDTPTFKAPDFNGVQTEFKHAFIQCLDQFWRQFGTLTHSVYLYGSIAKGTAVAGQSDLDLSVVLHQPISEPIAARLKTFEQEMEQQHPVFSKIELDVGTYDDVMVHNHYEWQYWLKHVCICLKGIDLAQRIQPYEPSLSTSLAINQDVRARFYRFLASSNNEPSKEAIKSMAKKLLRTHYALTSFTTEAPETTIDLMANTLKNKNRSLEYELNRVTRYAQGNINPILFELDALTQYAEHVIQLYQKVNDQNGQPYSLD
jgi:hypothetical protein